jgi:hypothetical protein
MGDAIDSLKLQEGERFRRLENHAKGIYSCGWLFAGDVEFKYEAMLAALTLLDAERIKATLKTDKGDYAVNAVDRELVVERRDGETDNRVEIIAFHNLDWESIEAGLLESCMNDRSSGL